MNASRDRKHILLIDQQPYWRQISTDALERVGFAVGTLNTYDYAQAADKDPDLVLLGCARVGNEEQQLISQVLAHKRHLLICCTSFTANTMRQLFLQGVDDIVDKPYNPASLTRIVRQVIKHAPRQQAIPLAESRGIT